MNKKVSYLRILLLLIIIFGRLLFYIPNKKYDLILNSQNYYILSCILILIGIIIIFLIMKNKSSLKKILSFIVLTIFIFTCTEVYFLTHLPQYTYIEATNQVNELEKNNKSLYKLIMPKYFEDKVGKINSSYLQINHSIYYVYFLSKDDEILAYRFDPMNGKYQQCSYKKLSE